MPARANPAGVSYLVNVTTSFGTKFSDCFTFDTAGNLTVTGYGTLNWTAQNLGNAPGKFQSVSPLAVATSVGFSIEFSGYAFGNATQGYFKGQGSDEFGDSYVVAGPPSTCSGSVSNVAGAQYRHP